MADPLSIASACAGFLGMAATVTMSIVSFIREYKEAADDLNAVQQELTSLEGVLAQIKTETQQSPEIPANLQEQAISIINSCSHIARNIETVIQNHRGKTGAAKWVLTGRDEVDRLRVDLSERRQLLTIIISLMVASLSRVIKEDTTRIIEILSGMRNDNMDVTKDSSDRGYIKEWVDNLTTCAESVIDPLEGEIQYDCSLEEKIKSINVNEVYITSWSLNLE